MTPRKLSNVLLRNLLPPLVVLVLFLGLWQVGVMVTHVKPFLIPPPLAVGQALVEHRADLLEASLSTGRSALIGFALSLVVGCLMAFVMAQAKVLELSLYPYAIFLQTVPIIAIAPIIILWFGPGMRSIIVVSFIISLFPIVTNAAAGLTNVPSGWSELMGVYDASWWQRLIKLRLPAAVPHIVVGAKISAGLSVVGAIVGEYFTSVTGEGFGIAYLVIVNAENARTPYLFATTLTSALLGLLIFGVVSLLGGLILRFGHFNDNAA